MINFEFKGHKISICNDDWRRLKERFDVKNAEQDEFNNWSIQIPCSLCKRYRKRFGNCGKCPLDEIRGEFLGGCANLLNSILKKEYAGFSVNEISWFPEENRQARRQLKAILRRMEKIEAEQEK